MSVVAYHSSETKADLYSRIPSNWEVILLLGDSAKGDTPATNWQFDPNSSATDDFVAGVIKPTSVVGNGRYIRINNLHVQPDYNQSDSSAPDFIKNKPTLKRQEIYSGTTNASGLLNVTFLPAFTSAPNVQPVGIGLSDNQNIRVVSVSATGCQIHAYQRNSINLLGVDLLLFTTANVSGASIEVLASQK